VTGLANQARALNVKAAGYAQVDVWSVVYRADGFVGAVTMVGPDATEASVKKLATQAYQVRRPDPGLVGPGQFDLSSSTAVRDWWHD